MVEPGAPKPDFHPYVPADRSMPELTAKAIIIGAMFGIAFGAATVYLALKAGLTVSASIPIAVQPTGRPSGPGAPCAILSRPNGAWVHGAPIPNAQHRFRPDAHK